MIQADITTTEASISMLAQCVSAVLPYCLAVEAIQLGPQPMVIDGQNAGSWDPLANAAAIETALQTAQQDCEGFNGMVVPFLGAMPQLIANAVGSAGTSGILNDLSVIEPIMASIATGATPTDAQMQAVNASLADIVSQINTLQGELSQIQDGVTAFQQNMSSDVEALTNSSTSISAAISSINYYYQQDVEQYVGEIGGDAIINILSTITNEVVSGLQTAQTAVNNAVGLEGTVGPALTAIQGLFDGMYNDYNNVAKEAAAASAATFGSVMQQIDITLLQTFWKDLVTYTADNGFGTAPI